jgi:hypothetical protein
MIRMAVIFPMVSRFTLTHCYALQPYNLPWLVLGVLLLHAPRGVLGRIENFEYGIQVDEVPDIVS